MRWFFRAYLILFILNIADSIFCVLWPVIYGELHHFPSFTETLKVLISIPWLFNTQLRADFEFVRGLFLLSILIILSIYVTDSARGAALQYEGTIFVGLLSLVLWSVFEQLSITSLESIDLASIAPQGEALNLIFVLIYHLPLAIFVVIIDYFVIYRYKAIATEIDTIERMMKV